MSYTKISRYSLTSKAHLTNAMREELMEALREGNHEIILTVGTEPMKLLCNTKRTLEKYRGSLTWSKELQTWILPSEHPSVVYVGDKKTLNSRYDKFDYLFDHIHRVASLAMGESMFPPVNGHDVPWEFIGHDGDGWDPEGYDAELGYDPVLSNGRRPWSGYYEATEAEVTRAQEIFTVWLDLLDRARVGKGQETVKFAIDTESRDTNVFRDKAFLMLQVYDGEKAYAFNRAVLHHPQVQPLVASFLGHGAARFYLWNTKYDRQVLFHEFRTSLEDRDLDGMVLAMGTTEKGKQCGLKYRSRQDLNAPFYEEELEVWVDYNAVDYSCIRPFILAEYGCKDVYYTYEDIPILLKRVQEEGTVKSVRETLHPAQRTLADIEYQGMNVDLEYARETSAAWTPKINDAIKAVQVFAARAGFPRPDSGIGKGHKAVCGCVPEFAHSYLESARVLSYAKLLREKSVDLHACERCENKRYVTNMDRTLNVNSPKQMNHLCFDILGMKRVQYEPESCGKDFWALNGNHPLAKLVAEYKELQHILKSFLDGVQRFVAEDGKVHPDFLLFGTKTGRLAIHDPAMQTIPQHSENAKYAKRLFIADDDDCLVVNVDYKSLEMFVAHHLTGDPVLLENLLGEWDVHTALAAKVYDKDPADVSPEERQSVKSVNFGAGYGISGFKLALDPAMEAATGGDPEKAQEFIDAFWDMYSVWSAKCDEWREAAHSDQYLTTELGRKRRWNLITRDNRNKVNNQAINFPGQSLASDLCLRSLIECHRYLQERGWGRVLLTVHDSLVFNIRREHLHSAVEYIRKQMCTPPFETTTPFAVDIEVGINYGDKEAYDPEKDYVNA